VSTAMVGGRSAAGQCPGGQSAADTGMAMDTMAWPHLPDTSRSEALVPEATDGQSADRSLITTSSTLPQEGPYGRPAGYGGGDCVRESRTSRSAI
jgi:hypothetical protein